MESTYIVRAIILNRLDFRENDSRIVCYSEEKGKLELVARGAKKVKSKLSGHIEPLTLSRLMVVAGKEINYVGTATGENFYAGIRANLEKIALAVKALALVDKMTREGEVDGHEQVFKLLKDYLEDLEEDVAPEGAGIEDFSEKLTSILGFSKEEFEELKQK